MAKVELDCRGLKCPVPALKMTVAVMTKKVNPGDTLEVLADCDTFERDVREWCTTMGKVLILFSDNPGGGKKAEIHC
jgi:tRNA 2-thiouridine synthesizing protein A